MTPQPPWLGPFSEEWEPEKWLITGTGRDRRSERHEGSGGRAITETERVAEVKKWHDGRQDNDDGTRGFGMATQLEWAWASGWGVHGRRWLTACD